MGEITGLTGTYRLLEQIGHGGSAQVYLAEDTVKQTKWAVKYLPADRPGRPAAGVRHTGHAMQEAQLLKRLQHPCIPSLREWIGEEDGDYLVMTYMPGRNLKQVIADGDVIPYRRMLQIGLALCDILIYLHTLDPPVIYRDLKPSNIILTDEGRICLVDFGIAGGASRTGESGRDSRGTRGYAAPEQYSGLSDVRTDVYGLGAALQALVRAQEQKKRRYPGLQEVLRCCTREDPDSRYPDAETVRKKLRRLGRYHFIPYWWG